MDDNPIVVWYTKDQWLCDFLVSVDQKNLSDEDAAREAFYKVAEHYKLPKFPWDKQNSDNEEEKISVFEEMAIAKFIFPEDELKGIVMLALYNVYTNEFIPIDDAAAIYYGDHDHIPDQYMAYYFGKDVNATLRFEIRNSSWVEAGATFVSKIIKC
ncbi:MAG: hypothetical protein HYX40_09530 [Sphingobacteriales bacterium]|nr:hypothetical protein [Sphingobacteriales bacterium]